MPHDDPQDHVEDAAHDAVQDAVDRHVARWRDRPELGLTFDEEVEAIITRLQRLNGHVRAIRRESAAAAGLEDFEYQTLHSLMLRDTPGHASPSELAATLRISGAGMTGRLDGLVRDGRVGRVPGTEDRRRVDITITDDGFEVWTKAGALVEDGENALVRALDADERATLSTLLKKMLLAAESSRGDVWG